MSEQKLVIYSENLADVTGGCAVLMTGMMRQRYAEWLSVISVSVRCNSFFLMSISS